MIMTPPDSPDQGYACATVLPSFPSRTTVQPDIAQQRLFVRPSTALERTRMLPAAGVFHVLHLPFICALSVGVLLALSYLHAVRLVQMITGCVRSLAPSLSATLPSELAISNCKQEVPVRCSRETVPLATSRPSGGYRHAALRETRIFRSHSSAE